jgi:hypothetical protein
LDSGSIPTAKFPKGICHENDNVKSLCLEKLNMERIKRKEIVIIEPNEPICEESLSFFLRKNDNIPLTKSKKIKKSIIYILQKSESKL